MPEGGSGESAVEFVRGRPAPPLRPLVAWYSGYRSAGVEPATHRGLPSPYLTLIVTLDDPLVVTAHPDPRTPAGCYDSLVGGLHTTPALITHDGRQSGVQLGLTPLGARALLGLPAGELVHADHDAVDVLGPFAYHLRERLLHARGWSERFAVLDAALLDRARLDVTLSADIAHAWRRLLATGGTLPVAALAEETGWSSRHLGQRFRVEFGLAPKEAARVVRFDRTRRTLQRWAGTQRRFTLAELAAGCGYYDQAHLAREFGALAGCPPTRWLAEEFRNIQAPGHLTTEGSPS